MFKTIRRIIHWCGKFKGKLYLGFLFSFFSHWFAAMPVMVAAYALGKLMKQEMGTEKFDTRWIGWSMLLLIAFVILRFLFDYFRARCQETISYELVARDRLAVGDALKRVSLGYFEQVNTGNILSSITTGLNTLETMGIRMVDNFIGGYLNFAVIFLCLLFYNPIVSLLALAATAFSFMFLLVISKYSVKNAPVSAEANRKLTSAVIEYVRGLAIVKSFGKSGASMKALSQAVSDSKKIHLKIERGFIPANCLHLFALKCGSVALAFASCYLGMTNQMEFEVMLVFLFFSFSIFGSLEPIGDSAHVLGVIDDAMDQLDALKESNYIDQDGKNISLKHFDIEFQNVDFGYDTRQILKNVSFSIPEKTSTAIVGPSGSGKTTICSLLARFYDADHGEIIIGGHNVKELTCDSLLSNISMVFQNVYLFHDTVRTNICFGKPDVSEREMIEAAKKARCHEFIMALPDGYDTVIGEGGSTLSGGEKQRISLARAILKDAPVIILDEATASIDPENEHLIQEAISELTRGKTIITIAYRLATIEEADQILVVEDGQIVQRGTHKELLQEKGRYQNFVKVRKRAEGWKIA